MEMNSFEMVPGASPSIFVPDADERRDTVTTSGVIHDLGNLIQIASSALSIMSRSPEMPLLHRQPMLARASASLESAANLVRQSLGSLRDNPSVVSEVSIAGVLFEIKALVDSMWEPALVLDIWIEVGLPKVKCDPLRLKNAVLNLIFNARDAMSDSGQVTIRANRLIERSEHATVELSVADQGVGMSSDTIDRAFEPFFTTKADGMGGIGLPMVELFVRDAGGRISIESEQGVGTTVFLHLPGCPRPEEGEADQPHAPSDEGAPPHAPQASAFLKE